MALNLDSVFGSLHHLTLWEPHATQRISREDYGPGDWPIYSENENSLNFGDGDCVTSSLVCICRRGMKAPLSRFHTRAISLVAEMLIKNEMQQKNISIYTSHLAPNITWRYIYSSILIVDFFLANVI